MNFKILLFHIFLIFCTINIIFGLSFGLIYPQRLFKSQQVETNCTLSLYNINSYKCCIEYCNNTLPFCDDLINNNISGQCLERLLYNNSNINCHIDCGNCSVVNILYTYNDFTQNVLYDCKMNETCVETKINTIIWPCWFDKRNIF
jgi:hypothetical protein